MKQIVRFDKQSLILTIVITIACMAGLLALWGNIVGMSVSLFIILVLFLSSLWFAPLSISADNRNISIHSSLKVRSISMADVADVELYRPLPGTIRICASGGFMGYWGTFRDSKVGRYTGFWGSDNECFLVTLTNGRKYLLGCKNTEAMVEDIRSKISKCRD